MLDGILLERAGTPTAVIVTDVFEATGRAMAESHGAGRFAWTVTPHPISNKTPDELSAEAARLLPGVLDLLTRNQ